MRVEFTAKAEFDLAEIGDNIRQDSPIRAERFTQELLDTCAGLADMPFTFPVVQRYRELEYRRKVYGRYLIFYRVTDDIFEILRIVHGARDLVRLLGPTDP